MGSSSKSGGASTTFDYYGTIACGICIGSVDDVVNIMLDGSEVWPQGASSWPTGNGAFNVSAGAMYVFDAQVWVAQQSFTVPANVANTDPTIPGNNPAYWVEYTFPRPTTFTPAGAAFSDFSIVTSDDTTYGTLRFYWGTSAQTVDAVLNGNNDAGDIHPTYAGIAYCVMGPLTSPGGSSGGFLLGQEIQSAPNIEIIVRRTPVQTVVTGTPATIVDGQCNLAAFIAEILTSANGIGLDAGTLDAVSFNNVATYLQANESLYGASPLIDTADTLRSVLDQFAQMIDGFIRFNPTTKLIELGCYRHGVAPAAYTTLTEDSLTERPQLKSTSWQQTYSRCTVRYNDRQCNFQQISLHADDPRAWAVLKSVRELSVDRPWITRSDQALLHGRETLRVRGHAQITGTLTVRREIGRTIRGGDYVLLDVDIEPNAQSIFQFFRVTKRTGGMTGPVKLEVEADNTLSAIPWNGQGAPILSNTENVPPVTNFRLAEIPTILAGIRGSVTALVQRPSNLITSCQLYFDTAANGTFSSLGVLSGFAAKGILANAIAISDTALTVNVDTTQPDADFFTQQYSANDAQDDTMLAIVVQPVLDNGTTPASSQVAEVSGYAVMEIMSVSTQTLLSAGQYQLTILRGRQNTAAQAFAANSEVWLIPRSNVVGFGSALFATLRANRAAGTTPSYALFRLCPATFATSLALSEGVSEPFRFPLMSLSAPTLALTAPASYTPAIAATQFPAVLPLSGLWTDPDGNLVEVKIMVRSSTETTDRLVADTIFTPTNSYPLASTVSFEKAGTYTVKLIARDSTNFVTETDLVVRVTGVATPACAPAQMFDCNGVELLDVSGAPTMIGHMVNGWNVAVRQIVPFGVLGISCSTPGATISFKTSGAVLQGGELITTTSTTQSMGKFTDTRYSSYDATAIQPVNIPITLSTNFFVQITCSAPGYVDSVTKFLIQNAK